MEKRKTTEGEGAPAKKQKTGTLPIVRGKFKSRWLAKHSSLLKRSDNAYGVMVTCGVSGETRALVIIYLSTALQQGLLN